MKKIVSFSPNFYYWQHSLPEMVLLNSISKNNRVKIIGCNGILSQTYCMAVENLDSQAPKKTCRECIANRKTISKYYDLDFLFIDDYISTSDVQNAKFRVDTLNIHEILNFYQNNENIGRKAAYDILLRLKKHNLCFNESELNFAKRVVSSCLLIDDVIEKNLTFLAPEIAISYNSLYSQNAVALNRLATHGAKVFFMHAGTNLTKRFSTMMLHKDYTWGNFYNNIKIWNNFRNASFSHGYKEVTNHLKVLISSTNPLVYSSQSSKSENDLNKFFNISKNQKVLVASMSSYDERFAVDYAGVQKEIPKPIFKTQFEWIKFLIEWIKNMPDLKLIIRVHPREFPNKRDHVFSEHAKELKKLFRFLPNNIIVNWPDDNISIYDLFKISDVVLNAWSSVGKEAALFGIPTVSYCKDIVLYAHSLNYFPNSQKDYSKLINEVLRVGWSKKLIKEAYDWHVFEFNYSQVDLSNNILIPEKQNNNIAIRILRKLGTILAPNYRLSQLARKSLKPVSDRGIINDLLHEKIGNIAEAKAENINDKKGNEINCHILAIYEYLQSLDPKFNKSKLGQRMKKGMEQKE